MNSSKEPVRLREREVKGGLRSLYLDIYFNGKRRYEFLRLYLVEEKTREDRRKNANTLRFAEDIRAKRVLDIRNGVYDFDCNVKGDGLFYSYYVAMCKRLFRSDNRGVWKIYNACLLRLEEYDSNIKTLLWRDIDERFIIGFRDYLLSCNDLSNNSAAIYFSKFSACCNRAHKDKVIKDNVLLGVCKIKSEDRERNFLSIDELRRLAAVQTKHKSLHRAFLFSCLTGMRYSDIVNLSWADVQQTGSGTRIVFKQKKTRAQEYLDINAEAVYLLGKRFNCVERVFVGLPSRCYINDIIGRWCESVGINKRITFHCARHTFAVMLLESGTDIYTVSKLLGHKELKTTQIYAKIVDKVKRAAVENLPRVLY